MTDNAMRDLIRAGIISLLAALLAATASMLYSNKVAQDSERKWCGIVSTLDDVYRKEPPGTPAGVEMAKQIKKLRGEFHCPPTGGVL